MLRSNVEEKSLVPQVLVVGTSPHGDEFARQVSDLPDQFKRVLFAETLAGNRPSAQTAPIDMVCFVVSMQSKLSFERFRQSVDSISPEEQAFFLLGRWAVVVLDSLDQGKFALTMDEVEAFCVGRGIPTVFVSKSANKLAVQSAAKRVLVMSKRAARYAQISPLFSQC